MTPAPSGPADGEIRDSHEHSSDAADTGAEAAETGVETAESSAGPEPDHSFTAGADATAEEAFAVEAMSHLDSLYGGALRLTRHQQDAEDLVQDTFAKAFRARKSFKPGTNMRAWLYRIMHNAFISTYRAQQRRPKEAYGEGVEDWQLHEAESHTSTGLRSAETEALEALPDGDIQDALNALREDYREAVYLADVEGFSYKEIAEIMDTPIGTVMSRLHRGRAELRRLLADYARDRGYLRDGE